MLKKTLLVGLLMGVISSAYAKDYTVFQCNTVNKKIVQVKMVGQNIEYRFGRSLQTPEIKLSIPKAKASTEQWDGRGPERYAVIIPNGAFQYRVYSVVNTDVGKLDTGIEVSKHDHRITAIYCDSQMKSYINEIENIDLPKADY